MPISPEVLGYDLKQAFNTNRLKGLWRLMSGFRLRYLGATVSLGISATTKTSTYLLLRYFIDHYLVAKDSIVTLPVIAVGFVLLAIFEGGFSFISGRLAAQTAEGTTRRLRNYLFDHIQRLTFTYHSSMDTGELIQRSTSDVDAVRRFFSDQAIGIGRVFILFIINFIALTQLNLKLALISVIVVPVVLIVSILFFRKIIKAYEDYQNQDAILSTTLQENLTGIRVVKAFARQEFEKDKFERDNREKFMRGKRLLKIQSLFWPVTDTVLCANHCRLPHRRINGHQRRNYCWHIPGLCRFDCLDHLPDA